MDPVHDRYIKFCRDFRAQGYADPRPTLEGLDPEQRRELETMIELFLAGEPPRPFDAGDLAASPLGATVAGVVEEALPADAAARHSAAEDPVAGWRELLPALRNQAKLRRDRLVEVLAENLGVVDSVEKVGFYYHHMERGSLPPEGVSDTVLDALAEILSIPPARLRRAGEAQAGHEFAGPEAVFARGVTGSDQPAAGQAELTPDLSEAGAVDRLFTGGREVPGEG